MHCLISHQRSTILVGLVLAFVCISASSAHAGTLTAMGAATISDIKSDEAVRAARYAAIGDGLRQIALTQPSRVLSSTLTHNQVQMHDSTLIASDLKLAALKLLEEEILGGVYRVKLEAEVTHPTADNSCRSRPSNIRQPVRIQLVGTQNQTLEFDSNAVLISGAASLAKQLSARGHATLPEINASLPKSDIYNASYLRSRSLDDELVVQISLQFSFDAVPLVRREQLNLVHAVNASGLLPVRLPSPNRELTGRVRAVINLPNGSTLASDWHATNGESASVLNWISNIANEVSVSLDCQHLSFTTLKLADGTLKLKAGTLQGIELGQQLLLVDKSKRLSFGLEEMSTAHFGLYKVISASRNHARLELLPGSLGVAAAGQKLVIPF